jgi:hypothetical protein
MEAQHNARAAFAQFIETGTALALFAQARNNRMAAGKLRLILDPYFMDLSVDSHEPTC